jgi:hypothetical protein
MAVLVLFLAFRTSVPNIRDFRIFFIVRKNNLWTGNRWQEADAGRAMLRRATLPGAPRPRSARALILKPG